MTPAPETFSALEQLQARRIKELEAALAVYADPLHWAISRDDLNYKVLSWIGPGATDAGLPNGMKVARDALGEHQQ